MAASVQNLIAGDTPRRVQKDADSPRRTGSVRLRRRRAGLDAPERAETCGAEVIALDLLASLTGTSIQGAWSLPLTSPLVTNISGYEAPTRSVSAPRSTEPRAARRARYRTGPRGSSAGLSTGGSRQYRAGSWELA